MGRLTLDDSTRAKLAAVGGCVELCDAAGNILGYFTPAAVAGNQPQISDEEIERRKSEGSLYTYDEVIAHLRKL